MKSLLANSARSLCRKPALWAGSIQWFNPEAVVSVNRIHAVTGIVGGTITFLRQAGSQKAGTLANVLALPG